MSDLPRIAASRRHLLSALAAGGAALGSLGVGAAQANILTPPQPATGRANANGRFSGKVVLITGGNAGIGEATAKAFAMEGARVFFNGRREELGRRVENEIRAAGGEALYIRSDVRDEAQVAEFVKAGVARYGRLDIAFNNAGLFIPPAPMADIPVPGVDDVFRTNVMGVWFGMKYQIPLMVAQGGSVIINCASVGGYKGYPGISAYSASKAAVMSMTRTAALDYGQRNLRILSISPGGVDTPMRRGALAAQGRDPASPPPNAARRINTPEEMARAVMWLSSEECTFITGCDVDVTTGQMAI
jgi:NAD(P)-dependent dehydrogenase (short-subunit alcohol dehydrogenase family)